MSAHGCELKFELEIRHGAQTAYNHAQAMLACEVDCQTGVAGDLDVADVFEHLARKMDAFVESKQRCLAGIRCNGDDHALKNICRTTHKVVMAIGDRVERTRIHRTRHSSLGQEIACTR